jgi:hypothetical protein
MLPAMASDNAGIVSVIDFRRQSMVLQWHTLGGTWSAYDVPPSLVHGVALIRPGQPNICIYGHGGRLRLQVGPDQFPLAENSPSIRCTRGFASFGLRRRFSVVSSAGASLYSHAYWVNQTGEDFFRWLASRADDPAWRTDVARQWSEGVSAAVVRAS